MPPDSKHLETLRIHRPAEGGAKAWVVTIIVVLILAAAGGGGYWWFTRQAPVVVRSVPVRQASATAKEDRTLLNASGYVTARRQSTVSSKVTGKVIEVMVEEGMHVKEGQVLAKLDAANVESSLRLAEAQLEASKRELGETQANLEQSQREVDRLRQLVELKAATQLELDRQQTDVKSLAARLERQNAAITVGQREIDMRRQDLEDMVVKAPFSGVVTSKNAQPGEMISPMSAGGYTRTGICTIVDMTSLEIEVDVSESYIQRVEPGQGAEAVLDAYPTEPLPAHVIAIIPTADRQKATVKVRVGFDQLSPRILPDMSAKVAFQAPATGAAAAARTMIPKAALRQADGKDIVWIVRDGKVERRAVKIGSADGSEVSIAAGLGAGERVVVEGSDQLRDGSPVKEATP